MGIWRAIDEAMGYLFIYVIFFEGILIILCNIYNMFVPTLSMVEIFSSMIVEPSVSALSNVVKISGILTMCVVCVINSMINKKIKDAILAIVMFFVIITLVITLPLFISKLIEYNFAFRTAFVVTLKFFIGKYLIPWFFSLVCFIIFNIILFYIMKVMKGQKKGFNIQA